MVLCLLYSAILAFSFRPSHWPTISLFVIFSPIFCFQTHILLTVSANKCADLSIHYCHSMMLGSKILLQASLRRTSDLLTLVSFYIITDFSLLCKSKSCTEYSATTARYCSRIACTATATRFRSVQSAHKNIMYTRVFIIYLHSVHTLFIFFSYTKFIENQQCELIVWSNCT